MTETIRTFLIFPPLYPNLSEIIIVSWILRECSSWFLFSGWTPWRGFNSVLGGDSRLVLTCWLINMSVRPSKRLYISWYCSLSIWMFDMNVFFFLLLSFDSCCKIYLCFFGVRSYDARSDQHREVTSIWPIRGSQSVTVTISVTVTHWWLSCDYVYFYCFCILQ